MTTGRVWVAITWGGMIAKTPPQLSNSVSGWRQRLMKTFVDGCFILVVHVHAFTPRERATATRMRDNTHTKRNQWQSDLKNKQKRQRLISFVGKG
jgi:hypothetical protein